MHESVSQVLDLGRQALREHGVVYPSLEVTSVDGDTRLFVIAEMPESPRERHALMFLFGHAVVVGGTEEAPGVMIPGIEPRSLVTLMDAMYRTPSAEESASGNWRVSGHPDARECLVASRMDVDGQGEVVVQPYTRHANGIVFDEPITLSGGDDSTEFESPLLDQFWYGATVGLIETLGEEPERVLARRVVSLARLALGADVAFMAIPR